jgi:hypothetical protein
MDLTLADAVLYLDTCRTRLPFRFGMHTLTQAPLALLQVTVEADGRTVQGCASDLLVPKWFEKDATKTPADDVAALVDSATKAINHTTGRTGTAFDLWHGAFTAGTQGIDERAGDRLVHGYGSTLIERALIDAACRLAQVPFHEALRSDLLGLDLARLDPGVAAWTPNELNAPLHRVTLRHTVGMLDVLRETDLKERLNDGLPETLEADIDAHGLHCFKLKCCGDVDADTDRLIAIATLLRAKVGDSARLTLDGNEQFDDMQGVRSLMDRLDANQAGAWLKQHLLLFEQPLPRTCTFDPTRTDGIEGLGVPVIIDEADGAIDSLRDAAALGYGGTSVKNCKGVFRALLNRARCDLSDGRLLQSAEDLTNLPMIALQQDLCTISTLGIDHVERNGHHYFRGLDHLPAADIQAAAADHGDLYRDGFLHVHDGELHIGSIHCNGYGYAPSPDVNGRTRAEDWSWPSE